jgi:hypothetical protein
VLSGGTATRSVPARGWGCAGRELVYRQVRHNWLVPQPSRLASLLRSRRFGFWVLAVLWVLGSVLLVFGAHQLRFVLSNIDGIQYVRIAEDYAAGRLGDGLNAYWSPMISWTIVPLIKLGIESQYAFYLASAAWSSLGLGIGTWFVWRRSGYNLFASLAVLGTLFFLYAGNLSNMTPDLLVVTWTLGFAWTLTEVNDRLAIGSRRQRVLWGLLLGVVMGIGYYVKAFDIPVFIVVGLGWLAVRLIAVRSKDASTRWRDRARPLLVTPLAALIALILVATPFVTAISVKYGYPTIGSSFAVNFGGQKFGDDVGSDDATADSLQLPPPPNSYAISFGEDRTAQLNLKGDTAKASTADGTATAAGRATAPKGIVAKAAYYLDQRLMAFPYYVGKIGDFGPFSVPIAAFFLLLLAFGVISARRHRAAVLTMTVFVVYFLGYAAITSASTKGGNMRYYWPLLALSTVTAGLLWPAVWRRARRAGGWWRSALAVVLIALVPIAAASQLGLAHAYPFSTGASNAAIGYLRQATSEPSREVRAQQMIRDGVIPAHSRIVGSSGYQVQTLEYAFYMRAADVQLYGRSVPHNINDPRFQQVLRDNKIDFYFLFEPSQKPTLDVSAWGTVAKVYTFPGNCGSYDGKPSTECRLSLVKVTPN